MKVYLSGAMTGLPDFNSPAFHAEAARLRNEGYTVLNPAENPEPPCKSWAGYMRMAIAQVVQCDGVFMLTGWEASRGARLEHRIASELGLTIAYQREVA